MKTSVRTSVRRPRGGGLSRKPLSEGVPTRRKPSAGGYGSAGAVVEGCFGTVYVGLPDGLGLGMGLRMGGVQEWMILEFKNLRIWEFGDLRI